MLPPAIKGQVVETELNINTSSEFHNDKIQSELQEIEEYKEVQKKLGKSSRTSKSHSDVDISSNPWAFFKILKMLFNERKSHLNYFVT